MTDDMRARVREAILATYLAAPYNQGRVAPLNRDLLDDDSQYVEYANRYADAILPLITEAEQKARAKALREAAGAWTQGEWADAPRRADRVAERLANAQHVGDWLRRRADWLIGDVR